MYYLLLVAILVLGSALAIALYAGPNYMYDDIWYIEAAHLLAQGNSTFILSKFSFAFFKTVILAVSFKVFGYGSVQAILPNFAYFLVTIYLVFLIGKRMNGYALGLIAAFIAAITPFFVAHATRVNPDVDLGMVLALILYLFFRYVDTSKSKRHTGLYMPFMIGLATSFAVYFKIEGFIVIFAMVASILVLYIYFNTNAKRDIRYRRIMNKRFIAYSAIGLVAGLSLYLLVFYIFTGNPFWIIGGYNGAITPSSLSRQAIIVGLLNPNTLYLNSTNFNPDLVPLGLVYIFAIIGTLLGVKKRNAAISFMSLITWIIFLYLFFGPASPSRFIIVPTVSRFFSSLIAPLSILSGYLVLSVYRGANRYVGSKWNLGLLLSLLMIILLVAINVPMYIGYHAYASTIHKTSRLFSSINSELLRLAAGSNMTVYLNNSVGFRQNFNLGMRFVSGYSRYETFFDIAASVQNGFTVYACPSVLPSHAYLVALTPIYMADNSSGVSSTIENWAGSNCTLNEVWNYSEENRYYIDMLPQRVRIYSVTETR